MKKIQNKAFTLVELIVVITILAILWTIAFISLQNYTSNARDWVRISDINNIKQNLGIFITEKWFYPTSDNWTQITYSWSTAWTQWTVWDNVTTNLINLSKKPTDPLSNNEYTYSVANNNVEYQLSYVTEWWLSYNIPLTNQANAATTKKAIAKVTGTYNEKILKVSTWATIYILAVPSIINSDINDARLEDIIIKKWLVYNNYQNLPDSYKNLWYTMTGWFDYNPSSIVIYTWSTYFTENAEKHTFINNLQQVYSWTILQWEWIYADIIKIDIVNNQKSAVLLADTYISNNVWGITWTPCNYIYSGSIIWTTWDRPYWITIDLALNIYTANYTPSNVTKITPSWISSTLWTTWLYPHWIINDSVWNVYVANDGWHNVTKITPSWISSVFWTTWHRLYWLTIDSVWNIYTVDYDTNSVTKITPSWVSSTLWTTWIQPIWITIDPAWNIYTANWWSNNVTKITPSWVSSTLWITWTSPWGIIIDSSWNIYTANTNSWNVTKITPSWVSSTLWTTWYAPRWITIDSSWNIYTANSASNNVTKITPSWVSSIVWTTWARPMWITIDPSWNLYTANYDSDNVTKFTRVSCY